MIKLDKEKKIALLTALQRGEIDELLLRQWCDNSLSSMTDDELEKKLCELDNKLERCEVMKRHGYCQYVKGGNVKLPRLTAADIVTAAQGSGLSLSDVVSECNRRSGTGEN